jgi:DNA-binding NarL/FixJ family response regulator
MQDKAINSQRSTSCPSADARDGRSNHHPKPEAENGKSERPRPIESLAKTKVLIVHRVPLIRFGLARMIGSSGGFEVCAETDDAPTARQLFVEHRPQIVVLGLALRRGDGIELIKDFRKLNAHAGTVVLSAHEDALSMQRAFRAGVRGYLVTADDIAEILIAFDQILSGDLYASPTVWRRLLENLANGAIESVTSELKTLSDRELQIFSLIGRGFGASRLANELHLSVKTIETHQMHIKEKLGLHSAVELSEKATRLMVASVRRNLQLRKEMSLSEIRNPRSKIRNPLSP